MSWSSLPSIAFILAAPLMAVSGVAQGDDTPRSELTFAPDRPGVGDSTAATPTGRGMIEGGVSSSFGGEGVTSVSAPGAVLRLGIASNLELRVGLPSVATGGDFSLSGPSLGVKVAGSLGESLSWSAVPTIAMAPLGAEGSGYASLSLNGALTQGDLGAWVSATPAYDFAGQAGVSGGGGMSYGLAFGGVYVNGGFDGASPFAGGGLWWLVAPAFQIDLGVDAAIADGDINPTLLLGTSFIL